MEFVSSRAVVTGFDTAAPSCTLAPGGRRVHDLRFERILIVDDNAIEQLRATVVSGELGACVEVVGSGSDALAALEASSAFRLVLMDCEMPDMSGLEATRRWRRIERTRPSAIPIVGLSRNGAADLAGCRAAGMNDCLSKPLDRSELERCFKRWLRTPSTFDRRSARTTFHEQ